MILDDGVDPVYLNRVGNVLELGSSTEHIVLSVEEVLKLHQFICDKFAPELLESL